MTSRMFTSENLTGDLVRKMLREKLDKKIGDKVCERRAQVAGNTEDDQKY